MGHPAIPRIEMWRGDWKIPTLNVAEGATFKDGAPGEGVGHSTRNQPPQGAAERYVGYGIAEAMP